MISSTPMFTSPILPIHEKESFVWISFIMVLALWILFIFKPRGMIKLFLYFPELFIASLFSFAGIFLESLSFNLFRDIFHLVKSIWWTASFFSREIFFLEFYMSSSSLVCLVLGPVVGPSSFKLLCLLCHIRSRFPITIPSFFLLYILVLVEHILQ